MLHYLPPHRYGAPNRIELLSEGFDVAELADALVANSQLWDERTERTAAPDSPHHGLNDIWCRFGGAGTSGAVPHQSIWYPPADLLPVRDIARQLMTLAGGEQLGGVLITRIPPGESCKPHTDIAWHARFYDKFAVQVAADPGQAFCFKGQSLITKPGDVFWFDNAHTHWVTNDTEHARITAIFCIKVDRSIR